MWLCSRVQPCAAGAAGCSRVETGCTGLLYGNSHGKSPVQPAQPDRPVSTIYNNIIGEGRAAPAAPDPSLDHFWRVLFGHFPKTVVKFIKKAPTKTTSTMVPMANSLAFWRRAGTTLYRVPSRHPGSPKNGLLQGCQGAPARCSTRVLPARDAATSPTGSAPAH